ncbi:MAG: DUF4148 domain-containing protein [Bacillota bacterium]
MNAKQLIAAVAVFSAAASAFAAGNTEYVDFNDFQSTQTRAEVRSALQQAPVAQNKEYVEFTNVASGKSRDEVRKEAVRAAGNPRVDGTYFGG